MQSLIETWARLGLRQRAMVVAATLVTLLAVLGLSRLATTPGMSLLYAGLDPAAAGGLITALDQRGLAYQVRGDAIYVATDQRDSLRMSLAAEGLPTRGGTGYELLDSLSGFGTTAQMFDAAYWRAKEGELARSILGNRQITAARVHIALAPSQPFQAALPPTASVTVTAGAGLTNDQAKAVRHLVAAAVPGLQPDRVEVIDTATGLLPLQTDATKLAAADRAAEIRQNVERLLAARVGPGKAVVEVSVDLVTDQETISERRFDPQGRVAISTETEQRDGSNTGATGAVTVASNLPDGNQTGADGSKSANSETRERVNYEVSETQREVLRTPGAIRRLSVAVLVDGQMVTANDGSQSLAPRPDDELAILRELVASAVGLDPERGDVLTLKSLTFEPRPVLGSLAEAGMFGALASLNATALIQTAILAVLALILGLFVLRPILAARSPRLPAVLALADGASQTEVALTGEIQDRPDLPQMPAAATDPVARLRSLIAERQIESVEILRGWMARDEEHR